MASKVDRCALAPLRKECSEKEEPERWAREEEQSSQRELFTTGLQQPDSMFYLSHEQNHRVSALEPLKLLSSLHIEY